MVALCPPRPPRSTTVSARVQPEACFEHEPNNHCVLIEQQVPSVCVCVCSDTKCNRHCQRSQVPPDYTKQRETLRAARHGSSVYKGDIAAQCY